MLPLVLCTNHVARRRVSSWSLYGMWCLSAVLVYSTRVSDSVIKVVYDVDSEQTTAILFSQGNTSSVWTFHILFSLHIYIDLDWHPIISDQDIKQMRKGWVISTAMNRLFAVYASLFSFEFSSITNYYYQNTLLFIFFFWGVPSFLFVFS